MCVPCDGPVLVYSLPSLCVLEVDTVGYKEGKMMDGPMLKFIYEPREEITSSSGNVTHLKQQKPICSVLSFINVLSYVFSSKGHGEIGDLTNIKVILSFVL